MQADPELPFGYADFSCPGVGDGVFTKTPPHFTEFDSEQKGELIEKFRGCFVKLKQYAVTTAKDTSILDDIQRTINEDEATKFYSLQVLFFSNDYTPQEKLQMFSVLTETMGISVFPIVALVINHDDHLELAIKLLGKKLTTHKQNSFPLSFSFYSGNTVASLSKLEKLWHGGGDPNDKHPTYGTLLHNFLANEQESFCLTIIDLLVTKFPLQYDFNSQDSEGKTPLLLAAKTRQFSVVKKLCALKDNGIDIGLDIADSEGRTPLMLSAALGDLTSFATLIKAGANQSLCDLEGRDLEFYLNADTEVITNILSSIHIEADRDAETNHNWIYFKDQLGRPVTDQTSIDTYKRVLISFTPKHAPILKNALLEARKIYEVYPDLLRYYMSQIGGFCSQITKGDNKGFAKWLDGDIPTPIRKTMLELCLEGKPLVKQFVQRRVTSQPRPFKLHI